MIRSRAAILFLPLLVGLAACSGDDDGDSSATTTAAGATSTTVAEAPAAVSEDDAIEIARDHVSEQDPDYELDAAFPVVRDHSDTYEISFPRDAEGAVALVGGEPHVVVDKATGDVVDYWWTA